MQNCQFTKVGRNRGKRNNEDTKQPENNELDGITKSLHTNNNSKCTWNEFTIERYRVAGWVKYQDPTICYLQEIRFSFKDTHRLRVKEWKKMFHASRIEKKVGVTIFITDKIDFKPKMVTSIKESQYIMIKG